MCVHLAKTQVLVSKLAGKQIALEKSKEVSRQEDVVACDKKTSDRNEIFVTYCSETAKFERRG